MEDITVFKFNSREWPLNQRLCVVASNYSGLPLEQISPYRESFYCFFLVEEGEASVKVNGAEAMVKAPELICGLPGDLWEWKDENRLWGRFICFEAPFILAGLKGGYSLDPISFLNPEQRYPFIPLSECKFQRLKLLVNDMEECMSENPVFYDLLRAQLWQFIFLSEKEYILNGNAGRKLECKNYLMRFMSLVNTHYAQHHDTGFYADQMHITPNYLNKICKTLIDTNARDYILNRILSEAKILLRLTNISVSELSYKLGFENTNYFIKIFKKNEGLTPGDYRRSGTL